ncbi:hypothetical protein LTR91_002795 [Friedmanniomyces endolithicus]|uniref:C2H2-type domain-containing protein n=1 Tax=Friedmanniomyces endolithicus TaxID=329885 RepID=A0AAN6R083_9PEZI|nr:hypothetical protein LTR57_009424 [Friedmanniomyces endolithicus]KAK0989675.1 hypothetical protein LTS01_008838 [Friedmanniomyces endolithicus]KAK1009655.1 hypothetical protein LTR91_002795 [Friedmanniomyces endolithicus]KAK1044127.1 hypothetical protein LTS16_007462 [Friedmanniomyces endolithicus]
MTVIAPAAAQQRIPGPTLSLSGRSLPIAGVDSAGCFASPIESPGLSPSGSASAAAVTSTSTSTTTTLSTLAIAPKSSSSSGLYVTFRILAVIHALRKRITERVLAKRSTGKKVTRARPEGKGKGRGKGGRVFCDDLEVRAYEEIDRYLGRKRIYPKTSTGLGRKGQGLGERFESKEGTEEEVHWLWRSLDRQVNVHDNTLATLAKDHKLFLGRKTTFRVEKLSLKRLIELLVLVKDLLHSLDRSSSDLQGVDRILRDDELGLGLDLDPDVYTSNLEHLLLCLRHQLIGLLIGNPIDLGRRHVSECQRDQKRRCLDWFFEYPDARHPESTTWPWSLKPSLAVLWGVCWMFHGPDGLDTPPRFDAEGNLVNEQGGVLVPSYIIVEYAQQLRQTSSYPPGGFQNLGDVEHPPHQPIMMSQLGPRRVSPTQPPQAANLRDNTSMPLSNPLHQHRRHAARAPDPPLASATSIHNLQYRAAPSSAWPPQAPTEQVCWPQDHSILARPSSGTNTSPLYNAYPADPTAWPVSSVADLEPRFDVRAASHLPPRSPLLTPPQIRLITSDDLLYDAQQPQDPNSYHSASSASSIPLHEDTFSNAYSLYPNTQHNYTMAQVQAPEAPMNGMHNHSMVPENPHSPLHDPALMVQGGRKRSHSEMSHQGMMYEMPPPNYPEPPHLQQEEAPRSRPGSAASAGPNSASPGAGDDYSPRGSRSFKRGDPPVNTENRYFCTFAAECDGQTFDRKCEWSKHMDKHDRPYRCPHAQCAKLQGFTYSGGLLRHEREVHGKHGGPKAQLSCPYEDCKRHSGKGFTRKENLNEHIRRVHNDRSAPLPQEQEQEHDPEAAASAAFKADLQEAIAGADQMPLSMAYPEPVQEQYIPEPAEMVKRRRVEVDDDLIAPPVGEEDIKQREINRLLAENAGQAARMREMETREAQRELRMNQLEEMLRVVSAQAQAQMAQERSIEAKILAVAGHT